MHHVPRAAGGYECAVPPRSKGRVAPPVLTFMAAGLVAVVLSAVLGAWLVQRAATREAIATPAPARPRTVPPPSSLPCRTPSWTRTLPPSPPWTKRCGALLDEDLVRVKLWSADGRILYSDENRLVGARYGIDEEDVEVLEAGGVEAEVSDLSNPENRFERRYRKLLEVYMGLVAPSGAPVLFETYFRFSAVNRYSTVAQLPTRAAGRTAPRLHRAAAAGVAHGPPHRARSD